MRARNQQTYHGHEENRHRLSRWGIHGAFTCGVLNRLLKVKEDEENGIGDTRSRRRFEIYGLSGTSTGALNAFMVWYGMMLKEGQPGRFAEARRTVNNLWDTLQV